MNLSKSILLPLGGIILVGACAPYPPSESRSRTEPAKPESTQAITSERQKKIDQSRERARRQAAARRSTQSSSSSSSQSPTTTSQASTPAKPNYPTAAAVPGKPGFVFNPYTHNIVDVKGIASGKLCRDPEDADASHKFRVP